ncbi:chaperonin 10-like protein [Crepidotus variabilis]|uniref:Chaperonin 10-like protein n=1 Tax=Crepidotus variabilis TaxID=179855 RepID=A0A9P6EG19_9AGAR|nr:chaperonin 10-like protein [Crepidotus variabilis]
MQAELKQIALTIREKFGPFVLSEAPIYKPGPGEVLIKLCASALNPADWLIQKSGRAVEKYPAILGFELAGEIVDVGPHVENLKRGDRVLTISRFIQNEFMCFQQYALGAAATIARIPDNITYEQAATLPLGLSTALTGLFSEFPHGAGLVPPFTPTTEGKYHGTPIVIIAGSSSVGQSTIQLAKLAGFSPIIVTASRRNTDFLMSLGANYVLDRGLEVTAFSEAVGVITAGKPVEIVFAALTNPETEKLAVSVLDKGGILISSNPDVSEIATKAEVKIAKVLASPSVPWNARLFTDFFTGKLTGWLERGDIKPNRVEIVEGGLAGVVGALKKLEENAVSGTKLVARPPETPALSKL